MVEDHLFSDYLGHNAGGSTVCIPEVGLCLGNEFFWPDDHVHDFKGIDNIFFVGLGYS